MWHWWPFAFAGFVLGVYGGAISLMLFLWARGNPDDALSAHGVATTAEITRIDGGEPGPRGLAPLRITYRFRSEKGLVYTGGSFSSRPGLTVGSTVPVEYLPDQPHLNRVRGGRLSLVPPLSQIFMLLFWGPGLLCLLAWLVAVFRLRRVMQEGDVASAELIHWQEIRFVLPTMIRVSYRFRDHQARLVAASHWIRGRSALGDRLRENPRRLAVVHDRLGRGPSRLVIATDFLPQPLAAHV